MLAYVGAEKEYVAGVRVVKNFTLNIASGETVALVGPSGCGKTTVLKMANRLVEATGGDVFFRDDNVQSIEPVQLRRQIGYVIQQVGLFPHMSVGENIAFVLRLLGWGMAEVKKRVAEMLEMVGLPVSSALLKPSQLSGGQQQRVGVARALASRPDLVLMDEPFGALDPITRRQIQNQMLTLKKTVKTSILLVTHDIQEAFRLADRIVIMNDGEILQVGEPEEFLCNPRNDYVREFIDSAFEYAHVVKQYQDDCDEKSGEKIESTF
jgi:osmoprotectant transport system ATP-binding protein